MNKPVACLNFISNMEKKGKKMNKPVDCLNFISNMEKKKEKEIGECKKMNQPMD